MTSNAPVVEPSQSASTEAVRRLQTIVNRLPGMVYQYRLHADGSSCFPYASEAMRTVFRVDPQDVREDATGALQCIHPDDYEGVLASIQKSAADLTPWQQEYRVQFDDAQPRWQLGNALPEREADGATLWHGFVTDITERKAAESARALEADQRTFGRIPAHLHELHEAVTQGMVADKKAVKSASSHPDNPAKVAQSLRATGAPKLPVGVSLLQLVPGRYKTVANAIMAATSPLQYNALMRSIALASGQFGMENSIHAGSTATLVNQAPLNAGAGLPKVASTTMADEAGQGPLAHAPSGDAA